MSDLIGEARVRVRPDTSGFQADVQSQLKPHLISIGKLITGALAIKGGVDFAKGIVADAARVQKSTEVIRTEFGKAGDSIIEFADNAGLKLGLASHVTESTAARFGILFKNIGVGKGEAAAMTLNLEKLAGSIAAIRGKDPAEILGTLPLALSGSLRGLRQLGFAFTPVQVKEEALRLGLIKTTKQALDPGARAIAIYGLVTKNLGDYQDQAAQHSADAYNVQKRLTAEWDHAKETLGAGLLPQLAKAGDELSRWIEKETKSGKLTRDFATVTHDAGVVVKDVVAIVRGGKQVFDDFSKVVGGDERAVRLLADAFFVLYLRSKLLKWGVIEAGVAGVGKAAVISGAEVKVAGEEATVAGVGWKRLAGGALLAETNVAGAGTPIVGVGDKAATSAGKVGKLSGALSGLARFGIITVGIEIVTHRKEVAGGIGNFIKGLTGSKELGAAAKTFEQGAIGLANPSVLGNDIAKHFRDGKKKAADSLKNDKPIPLLLTGNAFAEENAALKKKGESLGTTLAQSTAKGAAAAEKAGSSAIRALRTAAASDNAIAAQELDAARVQVDEARQTLSQAIKDAKTAVADSITSAKQNLNQIAASIAGSAGKTDDNAPLTGVLAKRLKELQARIKSGKADTTTVSLATELQNQIAVKANLPGAGAGLDRQLADLADLFNRGTISGKTADRRLDQILKKAGVNASVIQRGQGVAAADQFKAEVAAFKAQVAATGAGPQQKGSGFELAIVKPLQVLHDQQVIISRDRHQLESAQLTVQRDLAAEARKQTAEHKKEVKILEKIAAAQPSKHDTAELEALLRKQGTTKTAADAAAAARGRHHR